MKDDIIKDCKGMQLITFDKPKEKPDLAKQSKKHYDKRTGITGRNKGNKRG